MPSRHGITLLAAILILAVGCASLPDEVERVPSSAFTQPELTFLGRYFADGLSAHPGETGFLVLDTGKQALMARLAVIEVAERYASHDPWFGIEQEYTFFKDGRPLGWPQGGFPAPQGGYYCGIGDDEVFGRDVVEEHTSACIESGLEISGTNAEVMMGQWEFQIGPLGPVEVSDEIWLARWLLYRIGEDHQISATLNPKPIQGDWNGAGAHTNFSTKEMREAYDPIIAAAEALGKNHDEHIQNYGAGIDQRLTGLHETAPWTEFSYGVSDRGASVRIPWQVKIEGKGYLEDRRPNANMDPYVVTRLITETVCKDAEG